MAKGAAFELDGREYRVHPMSEQLRREFSTWLRKRAWQTIDLIRAERGEAAAQRAETQFARDNLAGLLSWGSTVAEDALFTLDGLRQHFLIRVRLNDPDAPADLADRLISAHGSDRLWKLIAEADGPDPKASPGDGPNSPGPSSPTSTA
jgi:hypothetical protein